MDKIKSTRGEQGFALVITLIITALLVALAVEFIDDVFVETSSRQNFIDAQQASLMANSGIEGGIKLLQFSTAGKNYTTLADPWAKPLKIDDEKGSLTVTIEDESGKLNLNYIVLQNGTQHKLYEVASRLFKKEGLSLDLLDSLADWLDNNDEPRPGGAENAYYLALKQPYQAKNNKLETFEELALVRGFDRLAISRLHSLATIYLDTSTDLLPRININTAPQKVLAALEGMSDELAKRVVDYRLTTPFKDKADLQKVPGIDTKVMSNDLAVKGTIYHIVSEATVHETTRTVETVVQNGTFLYWREF